MFEQTDAFSSFAVSSKADAIQFYGDVLGCDVEATAEGIELHFPNGNTIFMYEKPAHEPASFTVLNFPVDDIEKAVNDLLVKGVSMHIYDDLPAEQDGLGILRGKAAGMGPDIAWFSDPSGNILSVIEE